MTLTTTEKTPEQMMEEFRSGTVYFTPVQKKTDFHAMALNAAATLPNQSIQELLENARKIEWWLNEPKREWEEFRKQIKDL